MASNLRTVVLCPTTTSKRRVRYIWVSFPFICDLVHGSYSALTVLRLRGGEWVFSSCSVDWPGCTMGLQVRSSPSLHFSNNTFPIQSSWMQQCKSECKRTTYEAGLATSRNMSFRHAFTFLPIVRTCTAPDNPPYRKASRIGWSINVKGSYLLLTKQV